MIWGHPQSKKQRRTGDMVQAGQHLPLKCEALTSYPSTTNKTNQYLSWNVRKSSKTLSCRIVIQLVHFPVATFLHHILMMTWSVADTRVSFHQNLKLEQRIKGLKGVCPFHGALKIQCCLDYCSSPFYHLYQARFFSLTLFPWVIS
jgi:hypothetical protein